jgi:hypothetical protein
MEQKKGPPLVQSPNGTFMRVLLRFWENSPGVAFLQRRWSLGLPPETFKHIGYVRDALLILAIAALGTYFLENPDKFDAALNWMLGRHTGSSVV